MNVLIVSATSLEIKPLMKVLHFEQRIDANLSRYSYRELSVDLLITGVGMVQTAYLMGRAMASNEYRAAMNFGIAGSYRKDLEIGQVVHVAEDQFPELGAESGEYFLSLIDLKLLEENAFPYKNGEVVNENPIRSKVLKNLRQVRGITVNRAHATNTSIEKIRVRCNPDVESMEGAAFLYACKPEDIPATQVRAISNFAEERNPKNWNIALAIENLNKTIISLLNE
jgi:futalosine hydrolase